MLSLNFKYNYIKYLEENFDTDIDFIMLQHDIFQ